MALLFVNMIIPVMMIVVAILFWKYVPNKINYFFGFRTSLSMKNKETWTFAHRHISRVWLIIGIILLVVSVTMSLLFYENIIANLCILCGQLVILVVSIFPTIIALNKNFNKDGTPKVK